LFTKRNKIRIEVLYPFLWRIMMDLLTTAQVAKDWEISQRRVDILCKEGRVEGAIMMGNRWFIPQNSLKPEDKRRAKNITDCGGNSHG
jgi:DNA adenine methylase